MVMIMVMLAIYFDERGCEGLAIDEAFVFLEAVARGDGDDELALLEVAR